VCHSQKSILTSIGGVLARSLRVWQLFALKSGRVKPKTIHNWYSLLLWHARSIKEEDENHENSEGQQFHKYQQNKQPPQIIEHKKNPHQMTLEIHVQAWARNTNAGYPVSGIPNWLVWNRNHASEWSDRCTIGLTFKWSWSSILKSQLSVSVLYKVGIVISSKWNSKQITHPFNSWFGEFCMRHPYKTWCEF